MMNPEYGPYTYWNGSTDWLSRFAGEGNKWTAENNSWRWPGGRVGKWENDETENLDADRINQSMYTATATWQITPHIKLTNLASYLLQKTWHDDDAPPAPVALWEQLRAWRYDYWQEEAHVEGDLFKNKINYLVGFYYQHSRERDRTYSWAYNEFTLPSQPGNPILSGGNVPVPDQNLLNFVHAWGAANMNTPLGRTINAASGKSLASDLAKWKIPKKDAGYEAASPSDPNGQMTDEVNNDYSVFGNVTWHATSALDLQGGLRAAWNNGYHDTDLPTGAYRTFVLPQRGGGIGYGPGTPWKTGQVVIHEDPYPGGVIVTPMATVTYHWTPDFMTYARYAQGYTTGSSTFNSTLNETQNLPPEQVHSYEAGIRADWLNHRLRTNLTGYWMVWDGQRINESLLIQSGPNAGTFGTFTIGGGKSRARGIEAEVDANPIRGLKLAASMGYLDTEWLVFDTTKGFTPDTPWGLAPKWSYHLAAQYDFELANEAGITLRADYGHQSKYYTSGAPNFQVLPPFKGYGILNARVQYTAKGGHWNVQVFGTNLGDTAAILSGSGSFAGGNATTVALSPRRMWGVRFGFDY
jgi:iron complex outermembrane receptor protein